MISELSFPYVPAKISAGVDEIIASRGENTYGQFHQALYGMVSCALISLTNYPSFSCANDENNI